MLTMKASRKLCVDHLHCFRSLFDCFPKLFKAKEQQEKEYLEEKETGVSANKKVTNAGNAQFSFTYFGFPRAKEDKAIPTMTPKHQWTLWRKNSTPVHIQTTQMWTWSLKNHRRRKRLPSAQPLPKPPQRRKRLQRKRQQLRREGGGRKLPHHQ